MGRNAEGQLGGGTTTDRRDPVKILDGVQRAIAGPLHSLVVKADGSLWAMGCNGKGQLGDGTTTARHAPVKILDGILMSTQNRKQKRKRSSTEVVLNTMWSTRQFADAVVVCEDSELRVHRAVLGAASPVFERMFDSSMREGAESRG